MNVGQEGKEEVKNKKVITLVHSIPVPKEGGGEVQVNQIEIGRVKVKHLENLPKGFMENEGSVSPKDMIKFIAALSGLPIDSVREIDIDDLGTVTTELESFLAGSLSQETGKK